MHETVIQAANDIATACGRNVDFGYEVLIALSRLSTCEQITDGYMSLVFDDDRAADDDKYFKGHHLWVFPWTASFMYSLCRTEGKSVSEIVEQFVASGYEEKIKAANEKLDKMNYFFRISEVIDDTVETPCRTKDFIFRFCEPLEIDQEKARYIVHKVRAFRVYENSTDFSYIVEVLDTVDGDTLDMLNNLVDIILTYITKNAGTAEKLYQTKWVYNATTPEERQVLLDKITQIFMESGAFDDYAAARAGIPIRDILI